MFCYTSRLRNKNKNCEKIYLLRLRLTLKSAKVQVVVSLGSWHRTRDSSNQKTICVGRYNNACSWTWLWLLVNYEKSVAYRPHILSGKMAWQEFAGDPIDTISSRHPHSLGLQRTDRLSDMISKLPTWCLVEWMWGEVQPLEMNIFISHFLSNIGNSNETGVNNLGLLWGCWTTWFLFAAAVQILHRLVKSLFLRVPVTFLDLPVNGRFDDPKSFFVTLKCLFFVYPPNDYSGNVGKERLSTVSVSFTWTTPLGRLPGLLWITCHKTKVNFVSLDSIQSNHVTNSIVLNKLESSTVFLYL